MKVENISFTYIYVFPEEKPKIHGNVLPGIRKEKKKNRVSGIIRIYEVTKIKRDEL